MNIRYPIYEGVYRILTIEHGAGLESTALIGSFFALLGTAVFLVFNYMVFKPQRKLLLKGGI